MVRKPHSPLSRLNGYSNRRKLLAAISVVFIISGITTASMLMCFYLQTSRELDDVMHYRQSLQQTEGASVTLATYENEASPLKNAYVASDVVSSLDKGTQEFTVLAQAATTQPEATQDNNLPSAAMDQRIKQIEKDIEELKENYDSLRQDIFNCLLAALGVTAAAVVSLLVAYWGVSRRSQGQAKKTHSPRKRANTK